LTANYTYVPAHRYTGMPDPAVRPELFDGVLWRRAFGYLIDALCIGTIMILVWCLFAFLTVVSFGTLGPVLWFAFGFIPLAYHTLLLSGRHCATFGMRAMDLQLRSWSGERPMFLQALVHCFLFYLTVGPTFCLILLFALFNRRKRTLHDVLAGTLMVRTPRAAWSVEPNAW